MGRTVLILTICCLGFLTMASGAFAQEDNGGKTVNMPADPALIAHGAYLAKAGDCVTCHTRKEENAPKLAGGLPMSTAFGIIWSPNITPDPEYGIGGYTLEDFSRAMRKGIAKDGHNLYPAMPYPSFSKVSDEDIRALYAYFMYGVEPVAYAPPKTSLPFPFNQRWGITVWNHLFAPDEGYQPDKERSVTWNRGAYLVQGLGHCGACHTPRNFFFKEKGYTESSSAFLTGETLENWYAPNLRGDLGAGLGRWSEDDIVAFLKTGHGNGAVAFGAMGDVVENSTQYLKASDLTAIAGYLKSLSPAGKKASYLPLDGDSGDVKTEAYPLMPQGAGFYSQYCASCHMPDGSGKPPVIPGLAGNPAVLSENPASLIRLVLEGGTGPKTATGPKPKKMPGFAGKLTDRHIAQVLSYIRSSWGNHADPLTEDEVTSFRKALGEAKEAKKQKPE